MIQRQESISGNASGREIYPQRLYWQTIITNAKQILHEMDIMDLAVYCKTKLIPSVHP
jgi:hypothetical protein